MKTDHAPFTQYSAVLTACKTVVDHHSQDIGIVKTQNSSTA